ncbi:unnamed protein product [Moneuplotes crassus]|uniref:Uncharacterized protein n=1 Tax=Euplotes crassus TaxID=5936 RepID=A0AAD1X3J8_EUPCR|nr:unnamed protein product [Moneuplotes crassus]
MKTNKKRIRKDIKSKLKDKSKSSSSSSSSSSKSSKNKTRETNKSIRHKLNDSRYKRPEDKKNLDLSKTANEGKKSKRYRISRSRKKERVPANNQEGLQKNINLEHNSSMPFLPEGDGNIAIKNMCPTERLRTVKHTEATRKLAKRPNPRPNATISIERSQEKRNVFVAKKMDKNPSYLYHPENFLKDNIITAASNPQGSEKNRSIHGNDEKFLLKRSILGSIECYQKHDRQNNQAQSISVKFNKDTTLSRRGQTTNLNQGIEKSKKKKLVTIEYNGLQQLKKEIEARKNNNPDHKYESTATRKKKKIQELKKQSLETMQIRGARGYVLRPNELHKLKTAESQISVYDDCQTASIYFHNSNRNVGEKLSLQTQDLNLIEEKLKNREKRSKVRIKRTESRMNNKHKIIDLKTKRHLELYEKRTKEWEAQERKVSKALKRNRSQNLHSAIDNFRQKNEQKELAEKIAPVLEKYGENNLWKMNLRRCDQVEKRIFKLSKGDEFENKPYLLMDNPSKQVPVVRRPKSSYTNYNKRNSDNIVKTQYQKRNEWLKGINPMTVPEKKFILDRESADGLIIEGKNKLQKEIESAYNIKDKSQIIYKDVSSCKAANGHRCKIVPFLETQFIETMEEEVIAINYDKGLYA